MKNPAFIIEDQGAAFALGNKAHFRPTLAFIDSAFSPTGGLPLGGSCSRGGFDCEII